MSKKVHESYLKISGDNKSGIAAIDGVAKKMGAAEKSIKGFGNGISGTLSSITSSFTSLPLLAATAAAGVAGFAVKGVKEYREFDKGLRNINTIVNVSDSQLSALGDSVLDLSKKYGIAGPEINDALYQAVSAGIDATKVIEFMDDASVSSVAGLSTLTESVDVLTTVMNSYKMQTEEAGNVSDVLFQTVKLGKTTYSELARSLAQVTPLAASSNVEFEQIAAAVATLTKQGTPTAEAITQIRAAIIAMNDTLGDGWADVMTLQEGMAEMTKRAGGSNQKLKEMVGRIEGVNAILGTTGQNFRGAASDLGAMETAIGATQTAFGQQEQSLDFKLNRLAQTITFLSVKLGEELIPALSEVVDFIVDDAIPAIKAFDDAIYKGPMETLHKLRQDTDKNFNKEFGGETRKTLELIGDGLNKVGIGQYFDVHLTKAPKAGQYVKALADDYTDLWAANILFDEKTQPFSLIVNNAAAASNKVVELTEEQKKLAEEWNKTKASLENEIGLAGLPKAYQEFVRIDQKVAELQAKFGNKQFINDYAESMKLALIEAQSIPVTITPSYDSGKIDDLESSRYKMIGQQAKEAARVQIDAMTEVSTFELANLALRQQGTLDMFSNMSSAAYSFYQASGEQSKLAFDAYKAFSIAEASIATYHSAINAFESLSSIPIVGPALGYAAAAAAVAFGLAQVNQIASMRPGNRASGVSVPSSTSGAVTNNYSSNTSNAGASITINIQSSYKDPAQMVREDIIPQIEKHIRYGGTIKIN